MKTKIYFIVIIGLLAIFTNNSVSAQRVTSIYSGDLNAEKFQEKINIIDSEISKLEIKKTAELKEVRRNERRNRGGAYKLSAYDTAITVSPREAVCMKYDTLISALNRQKLELTDAMVNSKGNYIASTTSAEKAAVLYPAIKYAENIGNVTSNNSNTGNSQTVMLYIQNKSRYYAVTITSAPFAGITLAPGEKSKISYPVNVGIYSLTYTEYQVGTNRVKPITVNIAVAANTTATTMNIVDR
ncbi:MAG: hypothetical protein WC564_01005 [Patescibacteria group bacterium]